MHLKWLWRWLLRSFVLGVFFVSPDVYKWYVQGHPLTAGRLLDHVFLALVMAWLFILPTTAWLIYVVTWLCSALLGLFIYFRLDRSMHLTSGVDTILTYATTILPVLIGIGAVVLWQRSKREPKPTISGKIP